MPSIYIRAWMCLFCICLQCFNSASAGFASDVVDTFVKIKKPGQRDDDDDEDYKEADEQSSEAEQPEEIEIGKLDTGIVKNEVLYIAVISILGVVAGLIAIGWILHCIFARKKKAYDEEKPPPPDFIQKHKDYWDTVMQWAKKAPIHHLKMAKVKNGIPVNEPKISEIPEEKKTKASETKISLEIPQEKKEITAGEPKIFHKTKTKKISRKLQDRKKKKERIKSDKVLSKELKKVELQEVPQSSVEIQTKLPTIDQTTDKKELQQTSIMDQVSPVKESTPQIIKKVPEFGGKPEKVLEFKGKPERALETSSKKLKEYTWKETIIPKEICKVQIQSVPVEPIFKNQRIRCYMWNEDLPSGVQQPK
ncbi:uncharacterized protein LOC108695593 [Xenopus laevis]|uniref:Uncharacterized protein LOC108695593 n=1 Tax=Xenopus laevis TaxID=8355 RepID=A0A8J1L2H2_XENLA|nr:uncharacterized protein LOC108695593 [Xenopus laevis]